MDHVSKKSSGNNCAYITTLLTFAISNNFEGAPNFPASTPSFFIIAMAPGSPLFAAFARALTMSSVHSFGVAFAW